LSDLSTRNFNNLNGGKMSIKLEIPNNPACLYAARTFFDVLLGEAGESAMHKATTAPVTTVSELNVTTASANTPAPATLVPAPDPAAAAMAASNPTPVTTPASSPDEWPQKDANGVLRDKAGLPWDERIHATTKTCKKDGTWKILRGAQPLIVEQVEAELKAAMAAPDPSAATTTPVTADVLAEVAFHSANTSATSDTTIADAIAAVPDEQKFPDLMAALTPKFQDGSVTMETVNAACLELGLQQLALAATRPDLIPALVQKLGL
jgi:hypothetical protein